jgi:ubiquinone biosynthesis protein UbiJ
MLAIESVLTVAIIGAVGALLTAAITGAAGWLSSRKPKGARKVSGIALTHKVLTETIEWQDEQISELRTEVRQLRDRIRRLENDRQRGNP